MQIKYLSIIIIFLGTLLPGPSNFSEIVILSSTNVHGETEPCG